MCCIKYVALFSVCIFNLPKWCYAIDHIVSPFAFTTVKKTFIFLYLLDIFQSSSYSGLINYFTVLIISDFWKTAPFSSVTCQFPGSSQNSLDLFLICFLCELLSSLSHYVLLISMTNFYSLNFHILIYLSFLGDCICYHILIRIIYQYCSYLLLLLLLLPSRFSRVRLCVTP